MQPRISTVLFVVALLSPFAAHAQPNGEGFMPGHVFVSEIESHKAPGQGEENNWIREIDPFTGQSWRIADQADGLDIPNGLRFTQDGRRLRVLNFSNDTVMAFDSAGNGTVIYDINDGLRNPLGQNGLAFDAAGSFYVVNDGNFRILKFPGDTSPPIVFADLDDGIFGRAGIDFAADGDLYVARGTGLVLSINPLGVASVFDDFGGQVITRTLAFDSPGNLFVGVIDVPSDSKVYRYDGGLLENKRLLTSGIRAVQGQFGLTVAPDQRELYLVDFDRVYAVDAEDGTKRILFEFPQDTSPGYGIAVYIPPVPGDLNDDDVVNLVDYQLFLTCTAGPDNPVAPVACSRRRFLHADMDFDNDVDFADFAILQKAMSGP